MVEIVEAGLEEVRAALRRFPREIRQELPRMARDAGEPVEARAKELVRVRTGRARASIRIVGGARGVAVRAGGGSAFHARFLERGTKKMRAYPFLDPAVRQRGREVVDAFARGVRALIGRIF